MRTAEDMIADLRAHGRSDEQILAVAAVAHGGRLKPEVEQLLGSPAGAAIKARNKKKELTPDVCEVCNCPLDQHGKCPELENHIQEEQVKAVHVKQLQGFLPACGGAGIITLLFQEHLQAFANLWLVVDYYNLRGCGHRKNSAG